VAFEPIYKRPFSHFVKKQPKPFQAVIEDEVHAVCDNSRIGEAKAGDLAGILVHKFTFKKQEYLMAYHVPNVAPMQGEPAENELEPESSKPLPIIFYRIGTHENFYDDLKTYLKANGWHT
jgi:hypothetical protein